MPLKVDTFVQKKCRQFHSLNGLSSSSVRRIWITDQGVVAKTENEQAMWDGSEWRCVSLPVPPEPRASLHALSNPPFEDIVCSAFGPDSSIWIGGASGAAQYLHGSWTYFSGRRWLPHNYVHSIAVDAKGNAWVGTEKGVSWIYFAPITLQEKAEVYQTITEKRHVRDGFVAECSLLNAGDTSEIIPVVTPNDGLWTSLYIASQCFRYGVTKSPVAKENAIKSLMALLRLVEVTGVKGFMARSIVEVTERCLGCEDKNGDWCKGEGPYANYIWRDDPSSDEVDGHYMAWYLCYEMVASEEQQEIIRRACKDVTDHIIEHGYYLVGRNGKPTSWGVWAPERLNQDPEWLDERGLNSLEILSHLKVAHHICQDDKYEKAYRDLIHDHGYAINLINQKMLPPVGPDNHSDDELAWCAYYPLIQLEKDPELNRIYLLSLEKTWSMLKPQKSPFYNFLYGALTGNKCDAEVAVEWLKDTPLDLVDWTMLNSHRKDVVIATYRGRLGELQTNHVLPISERAIHKWNSNPYALDGGSGGVFELDGSFWLLPYWFGRYHRIIEG